MIGGWIVQALLGLPGLANRALDVLQARVRASGDERLAQIGSNKEVDLAILQSALREREIAAAQRAGDRSDPVARWMLPAILAPLVFHLWAIVLDSVFRFSWDVDKLPPPFDTIGHQVLLAVAGISAAGATVSGLIRVVKR